MDLFKTGITLGVLVLVGIQFAYAQDVVNPIAPQDNWTVHEQFTSILQGHEPLHSPYTGPNSLFPGTEGRTSITATLFLGRRLWEGASFYVNPEVIAGQGFSQTHGLAGFPNGEIYRVDNPDPKIVLSRLYYQQIWGFGTGTETLSSDQNQLGGPVPEIRLTMVGGKFSLVDFFDDNAYSHDPRTQFMNWALFTNGSWDYPADTRGYTYGFYAEYNQPRWAIRAASVLEPREANGLSLETRISRAHGDQIEMETRYHRESHPGKLRLLAWLNHAHMGSYQAALAQAVSSGAPPDVAATRDYSQKYGFGVNIEQELTKDLGFFSRAGWDDGRTETWAFTEIDRTVCAGLSLKGSAWHRPDDTLASAVVVNGLSPDHKNYLRAGGTSFLIGDGQLNYAPEQIWETYYALRVYQHVTLSPDVQLIKNPAFNADRGPVVIGAIRVHLEI